jgi:hypothetical protein
LCVALLAATAARADWQGKLVTTTDPPQADRGQGSRDGEIHAKKGKVRIDAEMGPMGKGFVLYDFKTKTLDMVAPAEKAYFEAGRSAAGAAETPAACERGSVDECLTSQGFKRSGADDVEGHACEVWERDRAAAQGMDVRQKVCVLPHASDMVWLKNVVQTPQATRVTIVKDYKETPQADSLFEVPEGYARRDMAALTQRMGQSQRQPSGQAPGKAQPDAPAKAQPANQ